MILPINKHYTDFTSISNKILSAKRREAEQQQLCCLLFHLVASAGYRDTHLKRVDTDEILIMARLIAINITDDK